MNRGAPGGTWGSGLALALALAAASAHADPHQVRKGDITISSRVVRASIPGSPNSAAYMVVANTGATPDALIAARCACAASADIHKTEDMRGMSTMVSAAPVVVPAHGQVVFQPGGYHVMLTGLKEPLRDGGQQAITLVFKRAGAISVSFRISAKIDVGTATPMRMGH
jgi:copper(I)-binding protein